MSWCAKTYLWLLRTRELVRHRKGLPSERYPDRGYRRAGHWPGTDVGPAGRAPRSHQDQRRRAARPHPAGHAQQANFEVMEYYLLGDSSTLVRGLTAAFDLLGRCSTVSKAIRRLLRPEEMLSLIYALGVEFVKGGGRHGT